MEQENTLLFSQEDVQQQIDDAMRIKQNAYAHVTPEAERSYVERSAATGVPVPVLRAQDNRELSRGDTLSGISNATKKLIIGNPSLGIVARGEEKQLDEFVSLAEFSAKSLDERKSDVLELIRQYGYTDTQIRDLKEAGFRPAGNGKWLAPKVGGKQLPSYTVMAGTALMKKEVSYTEEEFPLLPQWYASANERLSLPLRTMREQGPEGLMAQELKLAGVDEKDIAKALAADQTLMRGLNAVYGTAWHDYDDENLKAAVKYVGDTLKLDTEQFDLDRIRERTLSEYADPMIFKDFMGLASFWKAMTSDGTELEKLTYTANHLDEASTEEVNKLNALLHEQNRNFRGTTGTAGLAEGVLESGRFATELMATAGRSAVLRGGAALFGRAASKYGFLKTAGLFLKDILKGEVKRLPYYLPGIAGKELNELQTLNAYIREDGGMAAALSEKEADELAIGIANRTLETFITNFSERTGVFLDRAGAAGLRKAVSAIPVPLLRSAVGQTVQARFGQMTTSKWHTLYRSFLRKGGVSGIPGEYAEEKVETFFQWASTALAETLGTRLGDFGVGEVFGTPGEEAALFAKVALTNSVFHLPGTVGSVESMMESSRFIDQQKGLKAAIGKMQNVQQSPELVAQVYNELGLPPSGHAEPGALRILAQSEADSEILEKLGISEEQLSRAEVNGSLVEIPLDKAMGSLNEAQHERLMNIITPADVYTNATGEALREITDTSVEAVAKEREEFNKAYNETLAALSHLGRSTSEIRAVAKILGSYARYFARESGMTAAEWIKNVAFEKMKESDWQEKFEQGAKSKKPRRGLTAFQKDISLEGFNDSWKATVVLFEETADASTLIHEIEHYAVHMMECLVRSGLATERMADDLLTLEEWAAREVGDVEAGFKKYVNSNGVLSRDEGFETEMNEKIARAFERFVMEGVAPTTELLGAFSTLKRLIKGVYKSVQALGVNVSDDVRNVFNGMLSCEESASVTSELADVIKEIDIRLLGITQEEKKSFQKLIDLANDQAWQQLEAEKLKQLKLLRPQWRKDAQELIAEDKVFALWEKIKKAGGLDFNALADIAGEKTALALRDKGLTTSPGRKVKGAYPHAKKGVFPAELMEGFDSVEDMALALLESPSPYDFAEQYVKDTEAQFVENFSSGETALSVEAAATLLDKLSFSLEKAADRKGKYRRRGELRLRAEEELKGKTVRYIQSDKAVAKECSGHTRRLTEAVSKKDFAAALEEAMNLRYKLELLRFKNEARKAVSALDGTLRKAVKAKQSFMEGSHRDALLDLAWRLGLLKKDKNPASGKTAELIEDYNKRNPDVVFETSALALRGGANFKDLLYGEVPALNNLAAFIYTEGRSLVTGSGKKERELRKKLLKGWVKEIGEGKHEFVEDNAAINGVLWTVNRGTKLRNILGHSTDWDEDSSLKRDFYDPLNEAQSQALTLSKRARKAVTEAFDRLGKNSSKWNLDTIQDIRFPEELRRRFGRYRKWDAEMVVMLCLNMGTAKNVQRIDAGFRWGEDGEAYRSRVAALLSKEDWEDIQKIWDAISDKDIVSRLQTVFRNIYHFDMTMEEAVPFTVTTSDGAELELKGGYLPKKYKYRKSTHGNGGSNDPMKDAYSLPEYRRANFTKESLEEYDAPLDLTNSGTVLTHISEVAYYATHAELMRRLLPVIRDEAFASEFKYRRGAPTYKALLEIMENIANPGKWMEGETQLYEKFLRGLTTALSLWGSLRTAAMQLTSAPVGLHEVGWGYYKEAVKACFLRGKEVTEFIEKRSGFMESRRNSFDLDLKMLMDNSVKGGIKRWHAWAMANGGIFTVLADMAVARPMWLAAYNKALDEGKDSVRAAAAADEFVAKTQGGSRPIDASPIQLNATSRIFTMFFTSASAQATYTVASVAKMTTEGKPNWMALADTILAPRLLAALVGVAFSGSDEDDDDFFSAFGKEALGNAFSGMPGLEHISYALANGDMKSLSEVTLFRGVSLIAKSGTDAVSSLLEGDFYRAAYRTAEAAFASFSVPVPTAYERIIKVAEDWSDEDIISLDFRQRVGIKKPNKKKE